MEEKKDEEEDGEGPDVKDDDVDVRGYSKTFCWCFAVFHLLNSWCCLRFVTSSGSVVFLFFYFLFFCVLRHLSK